MNEAKTIILNAKNYFDQSEYESFVYNTIKTLGYNSNTFSLFNNLQNKFDVNRYKSDMVEHINECAKMQGHDENLNLSTDDFKSLVDASLDVITKEDLDGIMFDTNVELVDEYMRYNRFNGVDISSNVDTLLKDFESGADLVFNNPDYVDVKSDIYSDCGLVLNALDNLENDTLLDTANDFSLDDFQLEPENSLKR